MAGKIKGITLEIGGNTEPLDKALKKVNKTTGELQRELKQVETGLKFNPGNAELVAQKQQILAEAVENTAKKLDALKNAQADAEKRFAAGEIDASEYRKFQRELVKTESQLKDLQAQAKNVDVKATVTADTTGVDKVKSALKELGPAAKQAASEIGDHLKTAGAAGAAAVGGIVIGSNELNTDLARLRTNAEIAGRDLGAVEKAFEQIALVSGETDAAVETVSNLLATGFQDNQLEELIEGINGAAIRFSDTLKTEGIADGIQETFATGSAIGPFAELLERSGVNLDDFNTKLQAAKKTGQETDLVLQTFSELGLGQVTEKYKELNPEVAENAESTLGLQKVMAGLGLVLTPLIVDVTNFITKLVEWAKENPTLTKTLAIVSVAIAGISAAVTVLSPIITALIALWPVLAAGIGAISAPVVLVIAGLAALVAIGITLYKNWDTIKERACKLKTYLVAAFGVIKERVSEKFRAIVQAGAEKFRELKERITQPIEEAKNKVSEIIDRIKGFFSGLKLSLPKISMPKLPKFSLEGKFSLNPPRVPKLSVNWNADGGIFEKPTIFNTSAGLQGVGEAGPEAILPLNARVLGNIGKGIAETMNANNKPIVIQPAPIYLDGRAIGEATFQVIDSLQGNATSLRGVQFGVKL